MFESIMKFFNKLRKKEEKVTPNSKEAAKERLHLVLMQDRANVSADFLELMKQEIIEVIKKYIDIDEGAIDVRLTNKENEDGTNGAPALYANIPILNIKNEARKIEKHENKPEEVKNNKQEQIKNEDEKKQNTEDTKEKEMDTKKQEGKTEEKTQNKDEEAKDEKEKEQKQNQEIDKQEKTENEESESKEKVAEEKEVKEKLNQNKNSVH